MIAELMARIEIPEREHGANSRGRSDEEICHSANGRAASTLQV
jgi:hypothetical protein